MNARPRSIAGFGEQQRRRLHPRARARLAAVPARAAVLAQDGPAARARDRRRGAGGRPGADRAHAGEHDPARRARLAGLILKELLVGLAFAFALGALFAAVGRPGRSSTRSIGFSFGSLVDPINGNQSTVLASSTRCSALLVFIAINGDAWVIEGLARTYEVVAADRRAGVGTLVGGAQSLQRHLRLGGADLAPVMLALILTDAAFGWCRASCRSSTSSRSASRPRCWSALIVSARRCRSSAGWSATSSSRASSRRSQTLKVGR